MVRLIFSPNAGAAVMVPATALPSPVLLVRFGTSIRPIQPPTPHFVGANPVGDRRPSARLECDGGPQIPVAHRVRSYKGVRLQRISLL